VTATGGRARELPRHALEPILRRPAVGVDVDEHVARRNAPSRFARDDEPFAGFVDNAHAGDGGRRPRAVSACVIDDDDFVRQERLLK
jgi:hypothetical protein